MRPKPKPTSVLYQTVARAERYARLGHRVADISNVDDRVTCTCGWEGRIRDEQGQPTGFQTHRRSVGLPASG